MNETDPLTPRPPGPDCVCGRPLAECMEHTRALTDEEREAVHQWFRDNPREPS